MKPVFQKCHSETYKEFQRLTRGWSITFSYVYDSQSPVDLEFDLPDAEPDEQYLSFNVAEHGESGRRWLLEVSFLSLRAGGPTKQQLPYWSAHIGGVGSYDKAYSLDDARSLVLRSRAEAHLIAKAFEKK